MLPEGETAPAFELPAVVDEGVEQVALEDYLGQGVVILAFYPGDFNPACNDGTTDLDELDLFTMQKDVSILAISADSVSAHQAFADEFDLHIPLLSDPRGEVATNYGVAVDDPGEGFLVNRAVFVVGLDGTIEFAWATESLTELPPVERIRTSVDSVGGGRTAEARYGVGHAHYVEGRRQFTSAMEAFEDEEWMMARGDFERAEAEFSEAANEFNTAVRFAEEDEVRTYFDRAEDKAEALWQAAEWLAESANAYASGEGAEGIARREDAEAPLEEARAIHEPVDPAEFPPEEDPAERERGEEGSSILPNDEAEDVDASLEIDVDDAAGPDEPVDLADEGEPAAPTGEGDGPGVVAAGDDEPADGEDEPEDGESGDEIDDAELEEITAELEQQTEDAAAAEAEAAGESPGDATGGGGDGDAGAGAPDSPADSERPAGPAADEAPGTAEEGSAGMDWDADPTGVDGGDEPPTSAGAGGARGAGTDDGGGGGAELDEDDLELDLTDPSEGEDQLVEPEEREVGADGEAEVLGDDGDESVGDGAEAVEEPADEGEQPADEGEQLTDEAEAAAEEATGEEEDEDDDEDGTAEDGPAGGGDPGEGDHGVPDSL